MEPSSVGGQEEASRRELAHPWGKGLLTAFTASQGVHGLTANGRLLVIASRILPGDKIARRPGQT